MDAILHFKNLSIQYNKNTLAVNQVNLSVLRGSILVIVGESGSGKSTLIRSVIGLLPVGGEITTGQILYQNEDLAHIEASQMHMLRGNEIAIVFQDARAHLTPKRKIGSQFIESMRSHSFLSVKEARDIALDALKGVNIPDPARIMDAYAFELSSGMCQRVALAMAISEYSQPKLLLADEPTSSLDVTNQAQMIRQILGYRERFSTSIIMVTHNFGIAAYIADYIAIMRGGRLIEWGERDHVIIDPQNEYTRELLDAVPKMEGLR